MESRSSRRPTRRSRVARSAYGRRRIRSRRSTISRSSPNSMRTSVTTALLASGLLVSPPASGYRPFDGTDAAIADPDEIEIELGPFGYLREGPATYLVAPAIVANLGLAARWELVAEGKELFPFAGAHDGDPTLVDPALSIKTVLRAGSLQ